MEITIKNKNQIKWATRQRLQFIEVMAYYTGVITRSDIAKTFGISDAAATKDLKLYNDLLPTNLIYRHSVFGFVPSESFQEKFADLSPEQVLPIIARNLAVIGNPSGHEKIYGINVDRLPLPVRLPAKSVLAQLIRALKNQQRLRIVYHSLSEQENMDTRIIEPHSLVNTGLRWHVRAYSENSFDFRDFVLSRIVEAYLLDETAESNIIYDDDWNEIVVLELKPHPKLSEHTRKSLEFDYSINNGIIELKVRRALVGYVLQRLSVDTTLEHSLNPKAYQLVLQNREDIEAFAGWAFM